MMTELDEGISRAAARRKRKRSADLAAVFGSLGGIAVILGLVLFGLYQCSQPEEVSVEELEAREEAVADNRMKGFHCLSQWDGSNRSLVRQIKSRLRDPSSFEHVDTLITPVNYQTGKHGVTMTYRARNGFGGINVGQAIGEVDPKTCEATNVAMRE